MLPPELLLQVCGIRFARMYRCGAILLRYFHPKPGLVSATPRDSFLTFASPRSRFPVTEHVSSISTAAQVCSDLTRCEAPAVGQVTAMMMTDMDYLSQAKTGLAKSFWASCRREAYAMLYHPFVVSLAAGTLPKYSFQRYMAQDAYFLEAFKNAYQMAMESTEDKDVKAIIDSLKRDVQEELTLHSSVMQSLGGTDQNYFEPNAATVAYCDFLRSAAGRSSQTLKLASTSATIIAAMTPCMRLYAFLGQEIKKNVNETPDHPYQQWINTYSAADFEAAASKVEQLLDKLTESVSEEDEKTLLYNLYLRAMNLEVEFFSAQLLGPSVRVPLFKCHAAPETRLLLVSDFDSTCTISDSCPVLADLTVQTAGKIPGGRSASETVASLLRNKWDGLVMRYMDEYEELLNRRLSKQNHGSDGAFTAEELHDFLKEMSEFEHKANARIEEAAVLKGLSPAAIHDAGKSMPLREGCADFFKRLGYEGGHHGSTHVLSVCWSKTFIESVLEQGGIHVGGVVANELVFDGNMSTGKLIFNVETALDKERHFVQILDDWIRLPSTDSATHHSVYVGDSLTDLLCLLRADVGVVLGDSSTVEQVYGEKMTSLFRKAVAMEQGSAEQLSGFVFTVSSWYEVEAFLLGPAAESRALQNL